MSVLWDVVVPIYFIGAVITWVIAIFYLQCSSRYDKALGARLVFLAPIWLVPAVIAVIRGVQWMWRLANWKMKL